MSAETTPARRTKRRYAHELYPHPEEGQTRPLSVEVPYLYAVAHGLDINETDWHELLMDGDTARARLAGQRTVQMIEARRVAFLADALHQGMTGDEAWAWVDARHWDYEGEALWERAEHYGVDPRQIRPSPILAERQKHDHWSEPDQRGWRTLVETANVPESECPVCTEPVTAEVTR
ncbi:hypothetical protein ACFS27_03310 [Promicromonospora vindobonensis]|uniref:Uncharacterized protein n=1 Tax=Promicromonospora vindobonensis TaxID=195748 RepID=A0ABW5VNQ2_9MICO